MNLDAAGEDTSASATLVRDEAIRSVDVAMSLERPAKQAIRRLWLEQAQHFHQLYPQDDVPLYLTLSGAEAKDIELLADYDIIKLTEVGGIAEESMRRVVAIEQNPQAVLNLKKRFPGLQIVQQNFAGIVSGDSPISFSKNKDHENFCCAKIVNLDFQDTLKAKETPSGTIFPVFSWVRKVSQLHTARKPQEDWCLLLTLNGTLASSEAGGSVTWSELISREMQAFLSENFKTSPQFAVSCQALLGDVLQARIQSDSLLDLGVLSLEEQQKLLMVFVPKKISRLVHDQNWQVKTVWNLRYGGSGSAAPMVTWIMSFVWDARASSTPEAVYRDSLRAVLTAAGYIEDDGQLQILDLG